MLRLKMALLCQFSLKRYEIQSKILLEPSSFSLGRGVDGRVEGGSRRGFHGFPHFPQTPIRFGRP